MDQMFKVHIQANKPVKWPNANTPEEEKKNAKLELSRLLEPNKRLGPIFAWNEAWAGPHLLASFQLWATLGFSNC